jgi:hypothetical protein
MILVEGNKTSVDANANFISHLASPTRFFAHVVRYAEFPLVNLKAVALAAVGDWSINQV